MTQDKVAFITGANRGLGLETARALGKLGITVLIGSRDLAKGEAAANQLKKEGIANAEAVRFDAANRDDHRAVADLIDRRFGRLDILVNKGA
jgi:NAD(P)-dependent dehydrogenase (short-subunit alcohol dehydrogenase family)